MARLAAMMRSDMVTSNRPSIDGAFRSRFPVPRPVARLGVGGDTVGARGAAAHAIRVTHTPDVLTEETAETMRQFPAADRWRLWNGFRVDNVDA